jgi:hypothetical protein
LLDNAVAAFLDSATERAFDEPLLALLRAQGYSDVHLVHGAREFGKDVIARKTGEQWGLQSKAGNIGQRDWRELVGQLDELRLVNLGHGSFDISLPRRPVLVTTGRLTGNAPDLYRDYNQRARERGEPELELWDRDELIGRLSGNPDAVLRGELDGQLLAAVGSADEGNATMARIELFSRRWTSWEPERLAGLGVIEAALLGERLKAAGRLDLACHVALCLVCGSLAASAGSTAKGEMPSGAAGALFEAYALDLWDECDERLLRELDLAGRSGPSSWVSYPVRATRIGELIGLLALRLSTRSDARANEIAGWLVQFRAAQPGLAHPISDQYAVSLIPTALALAGVDREVARLFLERATVWLCDRHERGELGLAGTDASPTEEIEYLIGTPFDSIERAPRRESLIAAAVLDLCVAVGLGDLYSDVYNDVEAVRLHAWVLRLASGPDQYLRAGFANRLDPSVDFSEKLPDDPDQAAPHHADAAGRELVRAGRAWDLLAVSSALRDRWFWPALRAVGSSATDSPSEAAVA